jgi:hypothetical protein
MAIPGFTTVKSLSAQVSVKRRDAQVCLPLSALSVCSEILDVVT